MQQQAIEVRVNPSNETIHLGPLAVRFLLTGDDSNSSIAAFELFVPSAQRLMAPAHSHDHYEETIYGIAGVLSLTVDGKQIDVGPGQALCIPRGAVHRFDNFGTVDAKQLDQQVKDLQAKISDDAPDIPLLTFLNIVGFRKHVKGFKYFGDISIDFWRLWIDDSQ